MTGISRRTFFFASSGAAAGSLLVPGLLEAAGPEKLDFSTSGLATGNLKPLKHKEVPGFLSAAQIAPHHTAHYGGALKAFVGVEEKFEESFTSGTAIDAATFERMKQIQSSRGKDGRIPPSACIPFIAHAWIILALKDKQDLRPRS